MWGFVIWQIFNFLLILRNPRTVCSKHIVAKALNIVKRKLTHHMRIEICSHINLFFASLVSCFCYKILHIYIRAIIFDTTAKRIKELESRQKEIEIKITKEKSKKTFKLSRRNITTYFAEIFLSFFYEFYNRLDILKRMRMMIAIGFGNDRYR